MNTDVEIVLKNWNKITAIIPYLGNNNQKGAAVCYSNGTYNTFPNHTCNWLLDRLAKQLFTSIQKARTESIHILGEGSLKKPPLVLHEQLCLIQLYFPVCTSRYSSSSGYVALKNIHTVMEHELGGSRIVLFPKKMVLECSQKKRSIDQQIKMAHRLLMERNLHRTAMTAAEQTDITMIPSPMPTRGYDGS